MGRLAIQPNAENCTLEELNVAMAASPSRSAYDRMIAMRMLIQGASPAQITALFSIHRDTLTDWIKRFNTQGIDGLLDRRRPGRPSKIGPEQAPVLNALFEHPEQVARTHWTGTVFHGHITRQLEVEIGYSTLIRWLHDQGFRLKVPQPWPDRQDEELRRQFAQKLQEHLGNEQIELWAMDEMGVEGDPRPRRRWGKKGEKTRITHNGDHLRMNVMGMVCPRTGEFFALEMSHSDRECFQVFLKQANRQVTRERPRNLIILDNASWHRCKSIRWGAFEPFFLPPYSPDFNPIERLWLLIKAEWFNGFVARDRDQLMERLDRALLWVINRGSLNQKTCAFPVKL